MDVKKIIRWVVYVVSGLVAFVLVLAAVLAFVKIPIDLSAYKGLVESVASNALGRTVSVHDKIAVTTSLRPVFTLKGLKIANPNGFKANEFFSMETARIQVALLPLLRGKVHIMEFNVHGFDLALEVNKRGEVNWAFRPPAETGPGPTSESEPFSGTSGPMLTADTLVVEELVLKEISVDYSRYGQTRPARLTITECTGEMPAGKPFTLSLKGKTFKHPYVATIEIGSLQELVQDNRSRMEIQAEIADTRFEVSGDIDLAQVVKTLHVKASVAGSNLNSLDSLTGLALPPLKSYSAGGQLRLQQKRLELSDLSVQVGKSRLVGHLTVDKSGPRPVAAVELKAPVIQLDDFDMGDWSPDKASADQSQVQTAKQSTGAADKRKGEKAGPGRNIDRTAGTLAVFSPETLAKLDTRIKIAANKVMSGDDELGSGSLTATLKNGRISIDPVQLNIPGGSFLFATSLKPGRQATEASVRAKIENFDFGVLVHRANPKADMGGTISLDVELSSKAGRFEDLMARSSGHFNFSGRLENLKAGIIDLWAVNLVAAIVSSQKDQSKINCIIGLWDMTDGVLTPRVLLIDTSKIRICGKGQVDFTQKHIRLAAVPRPKKPEFFSLATPLAVNGTFSDFGVGIDSGGLIGTAIRFATSPVMTPLLRLAGKGLPADGADVCSMSIGPDSRQGEPATGCN